MAIRALNEKVQAAQQQQQALQQAAAPTIAHLNGASTVAELELSIQMASMQLAVFPGLLDAAKHDAELRLARLRQQLQERTFANARFKAEYDKYTLPPTDPRRPATITTAEQVYTKVNEFLDAYCREHGLMSDAEQQCLQTFYAAIRGETATHPDGATLGPVGATAELLWTSARPFRGMPPQHAHAFYRLINMALIHDQPLLAPSVAGFARAINDSLIVKPAREGRQRFPPERDGLYRTWRGGGFGLDGHASLSPAALRTFFTVGKKYRQPCFLATSFNESKADDFIGLATNTERVKWIVHFDPRGDRSHYATFDDRYRVKHVAYISHSHVGGEAEYLFAPYSVFTVRRVQWGTGTRPVHTIELDPAPEGKDESDDLPLAPWC